MNARALRKRLTFRQLTPLIEFRGRWLTRWDVMDGEEKLGRVEQKVLTSYLRAPGCRYGTRVPVLKWQVTRPALKGRFTTREAAVEALQRHHSNDVAVRAFVQSLTGVAV